MVITLVTKMTTASKLIIFLRHPESSKNVLTRFSSPDGHEEITNNGESQISNMIKVLNEPLLRSSAAYSGCCVICSSSARTKYTGEKLATAFTAEIIVDQDLDPILGGQIAGLEEVIARRTAPEFMHKLDLYRAGVVNSYDLKGYGEDVHAFERRVSRCLDRIALLQHEVIFVIAHRSSITAALILLARSSLGYPTDFYGYIPLDIGNASAVLFRRTGVIQWLGVNIALSELEKRLDDINYFLRPA